MLNNDRGIKWFDENVSAAYFFNNHDVERLMKEVEHNFTEYLENGDRAQAMKRLRVPPLEEIQEFGTVFRVGLFLGAFIVLLGIILILCTSLFSFISIPLYYVYASLKCFLGVVLIPLYSKNAIFNFFYISKNVSL